MRSPHKHKQIEIFFAFSSLELFRNFVIKWMSNFCMQFLCRLSAENEEKGRKKLMKKQKMEMRLLGLPHRLHLCLWLFPLCNCIRVCVYVWVHVLCWIDWCACLFAPTASSSSPFPLLVTAFTKWTHFTSSPVSNVFVLCFCVDVNFIYRQCIGYGFPHRIIISLLQWCCLLLLLVLSFPLYRLVLIFIQWNKSTKNKCNHVCLRQKNLLSTIFNF